MIRSDLLREMLDGHIASQDISRWGYCEQDEANSFASFQEWVEKGHHGELRYLTGERATKREALSSFFPQFQSAIIFLFSYSDIAKFLERFYQSGQSNGLKMASYVFGFEQQDYHSFLKKRLDKIATQLQREIPGLKYALSLDVHPVLERDLAVRSGLGWFGKNSMFINKDEGSFILLGAIFLSEKLNLLAMEEIVDHCGDCRACITACPTDAILKNRTLEVNKCISNFTIELFKDAIPPKGMEKANGEIFGCDICQDVCPWNKKKFRSLPTKQFSFKSELFEFLTEPCGDLIIRLEAMSNREFRRIFKGTPLERTGRLGMLKNLRFWKE